LHITGIVTTHLMNAPSLVLSYIGDEGRELNFLMDPQLLASTLEGTVMDPGATMRLTSAHGAELVAVGQSASSPDQRIIEASATSDRFGTRLVLRTPRAWALRWFNPAMQVLVPIALIGAGLVTFLVGMLTSRHGGLDEELRRGIEADEFEAHYQPTIEIATGACIGAEVLMRWKHPQSGYIRPDLFVAAAEASGLIDQLTIAQIKRVVVEMSPVLREHPHLHLGINLTAQHLSRSDSPALLRSYFSEATIPPKNILLEATERQAMEGDDPRRVMGQLRAEGFEIALDDFGTGYSSLSYLSEFKFQYLKIDASFIRRIGRDSVNTSVLDAIIEMGKALNVKLIAEGVETRDQAMFLHAKGVQYAQGWLYAKALPPDEFRSFLAQVPTPIHALPGEESAI
jgi:sensor c-di-GMP phosphodiesterase-like protein